MIIPLLGTRTGRPGDAPTPLCLCKTPAFAIPLPAQSPGNGSPTVCRLSRSKGSNVIGRIRDTGIRIGRRAPTRAPPGETGKRRSTIETIQDVRLKQFCARKPHGLSKPVNPREAKTSRWSLTTPAALFFAIRGTQDAHACLAVAEAPGEGCVSGAPLRDVGRRALALPRESATAPTRLTPAWLSLVSRSPQRQVSLAPLANGFCVLPGPLFFLR